VANTYEFRSPITRYFKQILFASFLAPKLVRGEGKRARSATAGFFATRDANRRSNRHFLGRAVCSVGETNNTQDSTPGLSEFGKVSQHLHCTLHCGFTFFSEQRNIACTKKYTRVHTRFRKSFRFYGRGRGCATFCRKIILQTSGQDASRHYSAKRPPDSLDYNFTMSSVCYNTNIALNIFSFFTEIRCSLNKK